MKSALYVGTVAHNRHLPKVHSFSYPFFMYFLDLEKLDEVPDLGFLFSVRKWAMNRFHRPDYFGSSNEPLGEAIKSRMKELTGETVTGKIFGLLNMRTLGLYFSPVNFYYGFDDNGGFTHFLAEVSNIPWNERHQYAHYIPRSGHKPSIKKKFKVSPFNPVDQQYIWKIGCPGEIIDVELEVCDNRGKVFNASLNVKRQPLNTASLAKQLVRKPVMTAFVVAGIYWQALRLLIKGVPYIPYEKERI